MTIQLDFVTGTSTVAQAAFGTAAAYWASQLTDNVDLRLTVDMRPLASGILASTQVAAMTVSYAAVRAAMQADAQGSTDAAALARLPVASAVSIYINGTLNNPNGIGSLVPYLDNDGGANNSSITLTTANAKALGLTVAADEQVAPNCIALCDASFVFNSNYLFDFDRSDGITGGEYDFTGIAVHEMGHALGFISGVDVLDRSSSGPYHDDDQFTFVSPLDLFRCSAAANSAGALLDWTAGNTPKGFSLNSDCSGQLAGFSTGAIQGDGWGAAHWKEGLGIGLMDPTSAQGELLVASAVDLAAMDAIGWNLAANSMSNAVPAPAGLALGGLWLAGLAAIRHRRRTRRAG